jgi:leucyl aminopeptidase (aminopeptidase T)
MSLIPIIPVEIKRIQDGPHTINPLIAKRMQLINGVRLAFENGEIIDMNDCSSAAHIKRQVLTYSDSQFKIANVKRIHASYESAPDNILKSIQNRTPLKLGSSCGIKADGTELTIFVFHEDYDGIKAGTIFLDARVSELPFQK